MMDTSIYKSLPEAKFLLDHIHKINPKYGIEIILPQQRWPNLKLNQTTDVMKMIHQHREVYLNASTNDLGMIYHTEASGYADLWIHILDENRNIIGLSINKLFEVNQNPLNYFQACMLSRDIQNLGIYPLLQDLRIAIFPANHILCRTQNPIVYKKYQEFCCKHGMSISPTLNKIYPQSIDIVKAAGFNIDDQSVSRNAINGEVLKETPIPDQEIASLWDRINIANGDLLVIICYK